MRIVTTKKAMGHLLAPFVNQFASSPTHKALQVHYISSPSAHSQTW